jgi:small subunit ribosomal protein S21
MLIIDVKDSESIDKALKKYKRKFEKSGVLKELRRRKQFTKPSVERRHEMIRAAYKLEKYGDQA